MLDGYRGISTTWSSSSSNFYFTALFNYLLHPAMLNCTSWHYPAMLRYLLPCTAGYLQYVIYGITSLGFYTPTFDAIVAGVVLRCGHMPLENGWQAGWQAGWLADWLAVGLKPTAELPSDPNLLVATQSQSPAAHLFVRTHRRTRTYAPLTSRLLFSPASAMRLQHPACPR